MVDDDGGRRAGRASVPPAAHDNCEGGCTVPFSLQGVRFPDETGRNPNRSTERERKHGMRLMILRTLLALGAAGSVAAGAPAPAPTSTRVDAVALSVSLSCELDGHTCYAYASGGTGGYSFSWTKATEYYSEPSYSEAIAHCGDYIGGVYVRVTVTDGLGATATAGRGVECNPF
jgi:hypothetical protein